jgi:threonine/homoserine/homoserine lactone efflux protein
MGKTFLEVLPLALAATISPTGLLFVMMILGGKEKPKPKSLQFVTGSALFLFLLGLLVFFTFKPAINATVSPSQTSAILDIVFGTLIVLFITHSVFVKKKDKPEKTKKHNRPYLLLGFLYMLVNVSTLIPFIAAVKIIATNKLAPLDDLGILVFVVVVSVLLVAFPVIISYTMPNKSKRILDPTNRFFSKYGAKIANVYFLLIAVYLILKGTAHL